MSVFSAENASVEIYLDDGTGNPLGSVLFDFVFRRASSRQLTVQHEEIPHAGYINNEILAGRPAWRLDLAKIVDGSDNDLLLTDALYYIRVTDHNDRYTSWVRYNCKKARRISWNMPEGDTGAIMATARFACESITPADV